MLYKNHLSLAKVIMKRIASQGNNSQGASLVVLQFTRGKYTKSNECLLILCSVDGYVLCVFVSILKILWMVTRNIKNVMSFTPGF